MAISPYDVEDAEAGAAARPLAFQPQTALPSPMQQAFTQLSGGQQSAQQQIQKLMQMLESRQTSSQVPWFQLAGAFLDPGRTGSFGEALGRAATTMGQYQAQREKEELPLAQMRFELLQRQQAVDNQSQALKLLSQGLGMPEKKVEGQLASGELPPANVLAMNPQLITAVGALSPEYGKLLQGQFENNVKLVQLAQEERKQGANEAELKMKYGDWISPYLKSTIPPPVPAPAPMPAAAGATAAPAAPGVRVQVGQPTKDNLDNMWKQIRALPDPGERSQAIAAFVREYPQYVDQIGPAVGVQPIPVRPQGPNVPADLSGLPPVEAMKVMSERLAKSDKAGRDQKDLLYTLSEPSIVASSNRRLKEIHDLGTSSPEIFGLMQKQGILPAMAAVAKEGARAGQTSISFDVEPFVRKMNLNEEQQNRLRRASQLLAEEFFTRAKSEKGVLGPAISNADVLLMQRPMATPEDSAKTITYWSKHGILMNKQLEAMNKALNEFDDKYPTAAPRQFFNSDPYRSVLNNYNSYYQQLVNKYGYK